ncbi:hypothetical protein [Vibrio agarivorans]|uniref:YrhK domain-containing protein n=1 Tax=Vibrio agarivorans TaxID=153622 RepID=A0ABT7Y7I5_9VIBR|nr:hypothetical protein [Vibrio agarivorans]MDN2484017.1 hypothetical protein [Vibrio agarivorans]
MKKQIIEFHRGLYVGSIHLGLGIILVSLSVLVDSSILSYSGIGLVAMGVFLFKDFKKYRDLEVTVEDLNDE